MARVILSRDGLERDKFSERSDLEAIPQSLDKINLGYDRLSESEIFTEEQISHIKSFKYEDRSVFNELYIEEQFNTSSPSVTFLGFDIFNELYSIAEEYIETDTIEWFSTAVTATEVTDPSKTLLAVLNPYIIDDNIRIEYEIMSNSTAVNIEEYLMSSNGFGALNFNGGADQVASVQFDALPQAFAKPARTVNVRLKNAVGTGSYSPKIAFTAPVTTGAVYIFERYVRHSEMGTGSTKEDQAQRFANTWNSLPNHQFYSGGNYSKAIAVATANVVEFIIDETLATVPFEFIFYNSGMDNVIMRGNLSGSYYIWMADKRRTGSWTINVGAKSICTVTIAAHGARPGIVNFLSYDAETRRVTKRSQVPQTSIVGLAEKIAEFQTRLKNKGF